MTITQSDIYSARAAVSSMRNSPEVDDMLSRIVDYAHPTFGTPKRTAIVVKKRRGHELHLRLPDPELRALESLLRDGETLCTAIRRLIAVEYLKKAGFNL